MKVEIWSDVMCPFCYIGKRNFESALQQFSGQEEVQVEWKSFQLDPTVVSGSGKNVFEYLAERKGFSYDQSVQMHRQVTQTARAAGLDYHFEKAKVANSYDAHRLIQLAKQHGLGDAAEERLFRAYFIEGHDIGNSDTLVMLGKEIGLDENMVRKMLGNNEYAVSVDSDIREAAQLGIRGVPFFVFDRKYAVSGAQPPAAFIQALQQSFNEWKQSTPATLAETSASCSVDDDNCK